MDESRMFSAQEVRAGSGVSMTHAERQAYIKDSRLGEILGIQHLVSGANQDQEKRSHY